MNIPYTDVDNVDSALHLHRISHKTAMIKDVTTSDIMWNIKAYKSPFFIITGKRGKMTLTAFISY